MSIEPQTLLDARRRNSGTIVSLPADAALRSQCIRLGLSIGSAFTCLERLPGGTIVVETSRQEIALGNALARAIGIAITG